VAAAYKPNMAFFEALGVEGWQALLDVMKLIPPEVPVLLDAKRGDISTTADAYATACLQVRVRVRVCASLTGLWPLVVCL
jgi:orotidine-5'-phosphate decarboxylase